jgi:hypothetical protein
MSIKTIEKVHARSNNSGSSGRQLLSLFMGFIGLVLALTIYPIKAQAQIVGNLEVKIPFPFYVGDTKLPPGEYAVHQRDDSNVRIMEISSADGTISALFDAKDAVANSTPRKTELIFNKYGDRYFLAELFDEGNPSGSRLVESRYEEKAKEAAKEAQTPTQEHVAAHRAPPRS